MTSSKDEEREGGAGGGEKSSGSQSWQVAIGPLSPSLLCSR